MPISDDIARTQVALFDSSDNDGVEHFLASGVFVAPSVVLTAAHVFDSSPPRRIWVRPYAAASPALPILGPVTRHRDGLDAAWFRIESMPREARVIEIDCSNPPDPGTAFSLCGYQGGLFRNPSPRTLHSFDPDARWYPVEPAHAGGMSGGSLCLENRLWGLAVARSTDAFSHSGFVHGIHQLWDGFLELLPGVAFKADTSPAVHCPAPGIAELTSELRRVIEDLLSRPPLDSWDWVGFRTDGLPTWCLATFESDVRARGERLLSFLADDLLPQLHRSFEEGDLTLDVAAARRVRRHLHKAFAIACRMCMDPIQLSKLRATQDLLELPASQAVSATLIERSDPLAALSTDPNSLSRSSRDRYAVQVGLEWGAGSDRRLGLLSQLASLKSRNNPAGTNVHLRNEKDIKEWRSFFLEERDQGRGRMVLVFASTDMFGPELIAWLQSCGIRVIQLRGDSAGLFWFEEDRLVGKINRLVDDFANHVLWRETHGSA